MQDFLLRRLPRPTGNVLVITKGERPGSPKTKAPTTYPGGKKAPPSLEHVTHSKLVWCVKTEDTIGDDGGRKRVTRKSEGYKVGIPGVVVKGVLS